MIYIISAILIIMIIFFKIKEQKLNIDVESFTKKGFKKTDDAFGVYLYTGKQGTGKTYSAVRFCENFRDENTVIITNVKSYADRCKCVYIISFIDIMEYCKNELKKKNKRKIIIFFDEIFTVIEKSGSLKKSFLSFLSQLRKRGIVLISTAQEWSEINITLRRYCRYQIDCNMRNLKLNKNALCVNSINDGDNIKWNNDVQEFIAPLIETNIFKGNKEIIDKYDTFEIIETAEDGLNKSRF